MDGMTEAALYALPIEDMARSPLVRQYIRRVLCGAAAGPVDAAALATLVATAFDLHDGGSIPAVVFDVAAEEISRLGSLAVPTTRTTTTMPVQRRTATLSTLDRARLDDLHRRTGMNPSAAVRVATRLLVEATPLEDYEPELDALADELKATEGGGKVWGYSVPAEEDEALSGVVRSLDHGPRRPSRSEVVRLGLRRIAALAEDELRRRFLDLDRATVTSTWRSGSGIHDDLIAALGNDFHDVSADELHRRISSALDQRVSWDPIHVDSDGTHRIVVRAWRSQPDAGSTPALIPIYSTDSARTFARRLVPFLCDAEEAVRGALRAARDQKLGRLP